MNDLIYGNAFNNIIYKPEKVTSTTLAFDITFLRSRIPHTDLTETAFV